MRVRKGSRRTHLAVITVVAATLLLPAAGAQAARVAPQVRASAARGERVQFLVLLRAGGGIAARAARATPQASAARTRLLVDRLRGTATATQGPVLSALRRAGASVQPLWIANAIAVTGTEAAVRAVAHRADVRAVEADTAVRGPADVGTPQPAPDPNGIEWNVDWVKAPDVWALGDTGQGVTVASADSGVLWDHPALRRHFRGWTETTADFNHNWWDGVRAQVDPSRPPSTCGYAVSTPCDDLGHGTHTTGTMVGDDGAGNQIGVAPGAQWIACRNLDDNVGSASTYLNCMQWLLAPTDLAGNDADPSLRPDVVNNSYACSPQESCAPDTLKDGYDAMKAAGIFMSTAAGNSGPSCSSAADPPAIYASAFTVGATSFRSNFIAFFSSRGPITSDGSGRMKPDVAAPGSDVRSATIPPDTYKSLSGTSMAAPHVAGVVALLWSAFPELRRNIDATADVLETSALHQPSSACGSSGDSPNNVYGYGTVNAFDAYQEALRRYSPQLSIADATIDKPRSGTATMTFEVTLDRASTDPVTVDYVAADGSATAPADYANTGGTLTLDSPHRSATITVPIVGDDRLKADDRFSVVLSNPTNARIARGSATGTIVTATPPSAAATTNGGATTQSSSSASTAPPPATVPELPLNLFDATASGGSGVVKLTLGLPGAGSVTAVGTHGAPAGAASALPQPSRRSVRWGPARRRASAGGPLRITLRPSGRARRLYRDHRRAGKALHVRVWATFTPAGGTPHTHALGPVRVLRRHRPAQARR